MTDFQNRVIELHEESQSLKAIYNSNGKSLIELEVKVLNYIENYLTLYTPLIKEYIDGFCNNLNHIERTQRGLYFNWGCYNLQIDRFWHISLGMNSKKCIFDSTISDRVELENFSKQYRTIFSGGDIIEVIECFAKIKEVYEEILTSNNSKSIYEDLIRQRMLKIEKANKFIESL